MLPTGLKRDGYIPNVGDEDEAPLHDELKDFLNDPAFFPGQQEPLVMPAVNQVLGWLPEPPGTLGEIPVMPVEDFEGIQTQASHTLDMTFWPIKTLFNDTLSAEIKAKCTEKQELIDSGKLHRLVVKVGHRISKQDYYTLCKFIQFHAVHAKRADPAICKSPIVMKRIPSKTVRWSVSGDHFISGFGACHKKIQNLNGTTHVLAELRRAEIRYNRTTQILHLYAYMSLKPRQDAQIHFDRMAMMKTSFLPKKEAKKEEE